MAWWQESDTFHDDPSWFELAGGDADRVDALQAAHCRLMSVAGHHVSGGYLTDRQVFDQCRRRRKTIELLTTAVLGGPPWLHRPGDECECLDEVWTPGYAYRLHKFLKKNPSRAEYNRNRAQVADLRNSPLKALVFARDAGCCRYCRSGPLSPKAGRSRDRRKVLSYDHVDPDAPAGVEGGNLVVSCGSCNEHKGRRTPAEADMILLPPPSEAERSAWSQREQQLFDRPAESPTNHQQNSNETPTEHRHDADPNSDGITDPNSERTADPNTDTAGEDRPRSAEQNTDQPPTSTPRPLGSGRGPAGAETSLFPAVNNPPEPSSTPTSTTAAAGPARPPHRIPRRSTGHPA